ncbi:C40 family peptidase [Clostridium baratii]
MLNEAYNHLGKPYVWGATGPNSFDCSGFTSYVYSKVTGRYIGRTTYDQIGAGRAVSRSELQPGDLVFPHAGHVGIYVGNGQIIHAPRTGDVVKVSPIWSFYAARRIL